MIFSALAITHSARLPIFLIEKIMIDIKDKVDFIDFGCSAGGNTKLVQNIYKNLRGIGIDIDMEKVKKAKENGVDAYSYDILKLRDEKIVSFVTMSHFLEHLESRSLVNSFMHKAVALATNFVHIRQPFFDADGYLLERGFKLFWSDWRGHKNNTTSLDFYKICQLLKNTNKITSYCIYGRSPIVDSNDECIVPLSAPIDSGKYDLHMGEKKDIRFDVPVFKELIIELLVDDKSNLIEGLHHYFKRKGKYYNLYSSV